MRVVEFYSLTAGENLESALVVRVNENWEWSGDERTIAFLKEELEWFPVNRPTYLIDKINGIITLDDLPRLFWGSYFWACYPQDETAEQTEKQEVELRENMRKISLQREKEIAL